MTNDELPDNLARALQALDGEATRTAARLDKERVATGVLDRLRREPATPVVPARRWHGVSLRVAAAAVVLVIGGAIAQRLAIAPVGEGRNDVAGLPVLLPADSLDSGQATELLAAVEQARAVPAGIADSATTTARTVLVEDLSEAELRTLLRIMESSEETK